MADHLLAALASFKAWKHGNDCSFQAADEAIRGVSEAVNGPSSTAPIQPSIVNDGQVSPCFVGATAAATAKGGREGIDSIVASVDRFYQRLDALHRAMLPAWNGQLLIADPTAQPPTPGGGGDPQHVPSLAEHLQTLLRGSVEGDVIVLRAGVFIDSISVCRSGVTLMASSHHTFATGIARPCGTNVLTPGGGKSVLSSSSTAPSLTVTSSNLRSVVCGLVITTDHSLYTSRSASTHTGSHHRATASTALSIQMSGAHNPSATVGKRCTTSDKTAAGDNEWDESHLFDRCHVESSNGIAVSVQLSCASRDDDAPPAISPRRTKLLRFRDCTLSAINGPVVRIRCTALPQSSDEVMCDEEGVGSRPLLRVVFDSCQLHLRDSIAAIVVEGAVSCVEVIFSSDSSVTYDGDSNSSTSTTSSSKLGLHAVLLKPHRDAVSRLLSPSSAPIVQLRASNNNKDENESTGVAVSGFSVSVVGVELPPSDLTSSALQSRHLHRPQHVHQRQGIVAAGAFIGHGQSAVIPLVDLFM